jgi:methyl-accepting chemotaxis protein
MALDDAGGKRVGRLRFLQPRREAELPGFMRAPAAHPLRRRPHAVGAAAQRRCAPAWACGGMLGWPPPAPMPARPGWGRRAWPDGVGLAVLLVVLFLAVAGGAWPVVRRLTRRLEALKQGVEAFGAGACTSAWPRTGRDEVAAVGASFNRAAARIEALLQSHQSLLANASHELRSPLARLKMAVQMLEDASPGATAGLRREIDTNIAELDALVEEVLLAGRLDAVRGAGCAATRRPAGPAGRRSRARGRRGAGRARAGAGR